MQNLEKCYVGKPDAAMSCPSGLEGAGRKRIPQGTTRRPSTLCHPFTGSRAQSAYHPGISGACFAYHHRHLHPSDPGQRRADRASHQPGLDPTVGLELADIFRQYGPAYRQKYAAHLLPSHRQAMRAIEHCRTQALGGQVFACPACGEIRYSYHSSRRTSGRCAAIAIAPSASTNKPRTGWNSNKDCSYPSLTSC